MAGRKPENQEDSKPKIEPEGDGVHSEEGDFSEADFAASDRAWAKIGSWVADEDDEEEIYPEDEEISETDSSLEIYHGGVDEI